MQSQKFRVLIVDDTVKNIQILGSILKEEGFLVSVAISGTEALKTLETVTPDLILLDIMMPGIDGYETCRQIKSHPEFEHIPVIFLTAKTEPEDIVRGFDLGAVDYITKPFSRPELLSRTKAHITLHKQAEELQSNYENLKKLRQKEAEYNRYVQDENSRLEQRIKERTRDLQIAYQQLEIANQKLHDLSETKSDFIKMIAHELRTPLHGMAAVEILFLNQDLEPEEIEQLQDIFKTSYKKLMEIAEHSISLTELKAGVSKDRGKVLALREIIDEAVRQGSEFAVSRKIDLELLGTVGVNVKGNFDELVLAVKCLLIAGTKFSDGSDSLRIDWSSGQDGVQLTIRSRGYHLPDQYKDKIFDAMAISETLFPGGDLGLGPALAKHILQLHDGTLDAQSTSKDSVTITVKLPKT